MAGLRRDHRDLPSLIFHKAAPGTAPVQLSLSGNDLSFVCVDPVDVGLGENRPTDRDGRVRASEDDAAVRGDVHRRVEDIGTGKHAEVITINAGTADVARAENFIRAGESGNAWLPLSGFVARKRHESRYGEAVLTA